MERYKDAESPSIQWVSGFSGGSEVVSEGRWNFSLRISWWVKMVH
jgi:hypothetical protein